MSTNLLSRRMDLIHSVSEDGMTHTLTMDTSYPVKINGFVQKIFLAQAPYINHDMRAGQGNDVFIIKNELDKGTVCTIKKENVFDISGKQLRNGAFNTGDYVVALIDLISKKIFIFSLQNSLIGTNDFSREMVYYCNGENDNVVLPGIIETFLEYNQTISEIDQTTNEFSISLGVDDIEEVMINSTFTISIVGKFGIDFSRTKFTYSSGNVRRNRSSIMTINNETYDGVSYDKNIDIVLDWKKCTIPKIVYNNHTCAAMYNTIQSSPDGDGNPRYFDYFKTHQSGSISSGAHFVDKANYNRVYGNLFPRRLVFLSIEGRGASKITCDNMCLTTFGTAIYIEDESNKSFSLNNSKITISDNFAEFPYVSTDFITYSSTNGKWDNDFCSYCDPYYNPIKAYHEGNLQANDMFCLSMPRYVGPVLDINCARAKISISNSQIMSDRNNGTVVHSLIINSSSNMRISNSIIKNDECADKKYVIETVPIEAEYSYINRYLGTSPIEEDLVSISDASTSIGYSIKNVTNYRTVIDEYSNIVNYNVFEAFIAKELYFNNNSVKSAPSAMMFKFIPSSSDSDTEKIQKMTTAYKGLTYYNFSDCMIKEKYVGNLNVLVNKIVHIALPRIDAISYKVEDPDGVNRNLIINKNRFYLDCKVKANPNSAYYGTIKNIPILYRSTYAKNMDKDRLHNNNKDDKFYETTVNGNIITDGELSGTYETSLIYDPNKESEFIPKINIDNCVVSSPAILYQESADTTFSTSFINSVTNRNFNYSPNPINVVSGALRIDSCNCLFDTREMKLGVETTDYNLIEMSFIKLYNPTIRDMGDDKLISTGNNKLLITADAFVRNNTPRYQGVVMLTSPSLYISNSKVTLLPNVLFNCPSFDAIGETTDTTKYNRSTKQLSTEYNNRLLFGRKSVVDPKEGDMLYQVLKPINSTSKNILSFVSSSESKLDNITANINYYMPFNSVLSTKIYLDNSEFNVADSFSYSEAFRMIPQFNPDTFNLSNIPRHNNNKSYGVFKDSYGVLVNVGKNVLDSYFMKSTTITIGSSMTKNDLISKIKTTLSDYFTNSNIDEVTKTIWNDGVLLPWNINNILVCTLNNSEYKYAFVAFSYTSGTRYTLYCKDTVFDLTTEDRCYMETFRASVSANEIDTLKNLGYFDYFESYLQMAYAIGDLNINTNMRVGMVNGKIKNSITGEYINDQNIDDHIYFVPLNGNTIHQTGMYQFDYLSDLVDRNVVSVDTIDKKFTTYGVIGFNCSNTLFNMTNCQIGSNNTGYARNTYGVESLVKRAPRIAISMNNGGIYNISNSAINAWATPVWSSLHRYAANNIIDMISEDTEPKNYHKVKLAWRGTEHPVDFTTINLADVGSVSINQCSLVNFSAFRYSSESEDWLDEINSISSRKASFLNKISKDINADAGYAKDIANQVSELNSEVQLVSESSVNCNEMPIMYIMNTSKANVKITSCNIHGNEIIIGSGIVTVSDSSYVNDTNGKAFFVTKHYGMINEREYSGSILKLYNNSIICIKDNINDYYIDREKSYYLPINAPILVDYSHCGMDKYKQVISPIHAVYGTTIDCKDNNFIFTQLSVREGTEPFYYNKSKINILYYDLNKFYDKLICFSTDPTARIQARIRKGKLAQAMLNMKKMVTGNLINFEGNKVTMHFECPILNANIGSGTDTIVSLIPEADIMSVIHFDNKITGGTINIRNNSIDTKLLITSKHKYGLVTEYYYKDKDEMVHKGNMYSYNKFDIFYRDKSYDRTKVYLKSYNQDVDMFGPESIESSFRLVGNYINVPGMAFASLFSGKYNKDPNLVNTRGVQYSRIVPRGSMNSSASVIPDPIVQYNNYQFKVTRNEDIVFERKDNRSMLTSEFDNNSLITTNHVPILYISPNLISNIPPSDIDDIGGNIGINICDNSILNYKFSGDGEKYYMHNKEYSNLDAIDITSLCDISIPGREDNENVYTNVSITNNIFNRTPRSIVVQPYDRSDTNIITPYLLNPNYVKYMDENSIAVDGYAISITEGDNQSINTIPMSGDVEKFVDEDYYIKNDPELLDNQNILNNNLNTDTISITIGDDTLYNLESTSNITPVINNALETNTLKVLPVLDNSIYKLYPTFGGLKEYKDYSAYRYDNMDTNFIVSYPTILSMLFQQVINSNDMKFFEKTSLNYYEAESAKVRNNVDASVLIPKYILKKIPLMMFPTRDSGYTDQTMYSADLSNAKHNGLRITYVDKSDIDNVIADNIESRDMTGKEQIFDANTVLSKNIKLFSMNNITDSQYHLKSLLHLKSTPADVGTIPIYYPKLKQLDTSIEDSMYAYLATPVTLKSSGAKLNVNVSYPFNVPGYDGGIALDVYFDSLYVIPSYYEEDVTKVTRDSELIIVHNLKPRFYNSFSTIDAILKEDKYSELDWAKDMDIRSAAAIAYYRARLYLSRNDLDNDPDKTTFMLRMDNLFRPFNYTIDTDESTGKTFMEYPKYNLKYSTATNNISTDTDDTSTTDTKKISRPEHSEVGKGKSNISNNKTTVKILDDDGNVQEVNRTDYFVNHVFTTIKDGVTYKLLGYYRFKKYEYGKVGKLRTTNINDDIDMYIKKPSFITDTATNKTHQEYRYVFMVENSSTGKIIMKYYDVTQPTQDAKKTNSPLYNTTVEKVLKLSNYLPYQDLLNSVGSNLQFDLRDKISAIRGSYMNTNTYTFLPGESCKNGIIPFHNQVYFRVTNGSAYPVSIASKKGTISTGYNDNYNYDTVKEQFMNRYTNEYILNTSSAAHIASFMSAKSMFSNYKLDLTDGVLDDIKEKYKNAYKNDTSEERINNKIKTCKGYIHMYILYADQNLSGYCPDKYKNDIDSLNANIEITRTNDNEDINKVTINKIGNIFNFIYINNNRTACFDFSELDYNGIPKFAEFYAALPRSTDTVLNQYVSTTVNTEVIGVRTNVISAFNEFGNCTTLENYYLKCDVYSKYHVSKSDNDRTIVQYNDGSEGKIYKNFNNVYLDTNQDSFTKSTIAYPDSYYIRLIDLVKMHKHLLYKDSGETYKNFYTKVNKVLDSNLKLQANLNSRIAYPIYGKTTITQDMLLTTLPEYLIKHCPIHTIDDYDELVKDTIPNTMNWLKGLDFTYSNTTDMIGTDTLYSQLYNTLIAQNNSTMPNYISTNIELGKNLDLDSVINYSVTLQDQDPTNYIFDHIVYDSIKSMRIDTVKKYVICTFETADLATLNPALTNATNMKYFNVVIPYETLVIDSNTNNNFNWVPTSASNINMSVDKSRINLLRNVKHNKIVLDATIYVETSFHNGSKSKSKSSLTPANLILNNKNVYLHIQDNNANLK